VQIKGISGSKIVWILAVILIVIIGILVGLEYAAESKVKLWLQGDLRTQLTEIRFQGQQREATCKNPNILLYLNAAARNARHESGPGAQISYGGNLKMGRLKTQLISTSVAKDHSCIGISIPRNLTITDEDDDYWLIPFGTDSPKELKALLDFLIEDKYRGQKYDDTR